MEIISASSPTPLSPCVATIGCFDGVHRGHRYLITQVCREAAQRNLLSALITFPVHPRQVMQSNYRPEWLTCLPQKESLIRALPADVCLLLPFTREVSLLSAYEFMQLLRNRFEVRALVIGYDHRFGHNRNEGFEDYCRYGQMLGIEIIHAPALTEGGISISSSLIRTLLKEGKADKANHYLGYRYFIDGKVVSGYRMGRKLGFPTANLQPSCPEKLIPMEGVYAVYGYVGEKQYAGMLNIGHRPTLENGHERSIEVHLLDFCGNIYDHSMRIEFVQFIRPEQKFSSLDLLTEQLHSDRETVRQLLRTK